MFSLPEFSEMRSVAFGGREEVPNPTAHTRGGQCVPEGSLSTNRDLCSSPGISVPAPLGLSTIIPRKHSQKAKCSFMEAREQNWKLTLCFYPRWKLLPTGGTFSKVHEQEEVMWDKQIPDQIIHQQNWQLWDCPVREKILIFI